MEHDTKYFVAGKTGISLIGKMKICSTHSGRRTKILRQEEKHPQLKQSQIRLHARIQKVLSEGSNFFFLFL